MNCGHAASFNAAPPSSFIPDVNECMLTSLCDLNAICVNFDGSYFCRCNDGYSGNGHQCVGKNKTTLIGDINNKPYSVKPGVKAFMENNC